MRNTVISLLLSIFSCLTLQAVVIPKEHVFKFERSTNSNYVCYDINLQDGKLCQNAPLKSYWVVDEGTRMSEVTFLERKVAFGIKVISSDENEAQVHMTAYKDLVIRICKHKGKWVGIVNVNGHEMILSKMFAQMKQSIYPRCEYVDVFGTDTTTGEKRRERIMA